MLLPPNMLSQPASAADYNWSAIAHAATSANFALSSHRVVAEPSLHLPKKFQYTSSSLPLRARCSSPNAHVPLDAESVRHDGESAWRVFLPLRKQDRRRVCSAAFFVGPSRQHTEFRVGVLMSVLRKTAWNKCVVERVLVPFSPVDSSVELPDRIPQLISEHPRYTLSLFPSSDGRDRIRHWRSIFVSGLPTSGGHCDCSTFFGTIGPIQLNGWLATKTMSPTIEMVPGTVAEISGSLCTLERQPTSVCEVVGRRCAVSILYASTPVTEDLSRDCG